MRDKGGIPFDKELSAFEEDRKLPYVSRFERRATLRATLKTRQDSIIDALEIRFGTIPDAIKNQVANLQDSDQVQALFKKTILVESIEDFQNLLNESQSVQ